MSVSSVYRQVSRRGSHQLTGQAGEYTRPQRRDRTRLARCRPEYRLYNVSAPEELMHDVDACAPAGYVWNGVRGLESKAGIVERGSQR